MKFHSVIFDLDGTLIDSLPDVVIATNRLLAEEGRPAITREQGSQMVGEGASPLIERAFLATGAAAAPDAIPELVERFVAHYRAAPAAETIVFSGVRDVLGALSSQGIIMGICTNKPHEMSVLVLEELGLAHHFRSVIGGDALAVKKPDPAHLEAVMRETGSVAANTLYVGDSPTDMECARAAKVPTIAVSWGYSRVPAAELGADILIDDYAQFLAAMEKLALTITDNS
jgi:phosphoglycolate phosphatase